ncbi:OsmC family protein [Gemmobacter serpentinus]|uniref:OsmC family protein n=1 Tax=Gemmobacter serpentinus TaxID=2652247 RepID=UPI00124E00BF|nr:OsmC family protein [Gemmobacter serpentinus]
MIVKSGSAVWRGGLKDGSGSVSTQSGALIDQPYGFATRFEGKAGTNPEELIAAAHASCFSMALSNILGQKDIVPEEIDTQVFITLENRDGGFVVTKSALEVVIHADADEAVLLEAAAVAKANCPISKLLNAEISMEARKG